MVNRVYRITNCQRAAFCGLMIAGLSFADACAVVDVSQQKIHHVLPPRWCSPPVPSRRYRSWSGQKLEQVRLAYADKSQSTKQICERHGIQRHYLYRLAVLHDWPRRIDPRRVNGRLQDRLTPDQFRLYRKLIANGVPGATAQAEVCR